jgi:hypothetical protein
MTLVIIKYLANFEETRWMALLMGSNENDE